MAAQNHQLTPVLGDRMPSSGLHGHCVQVVHRQINLQAKHRIKKFKEFKIILRYILSLKTAQTSRERVGRGWMDGKRRETETAERVCV